MIIDFLRRDLPKDVWNIVHNTSEPYIITAMQIINRSLGTGMFTVAFLDTAVVDGQQALDVDLYLLSNNLKCVFYSGELNQSEYYYWHPEGGRIIVPPTAKLGIVVSQVDLDVSIFGAEI